jgi:hypothetical protein
MLKKAVQQGRRSEDRRRYPPHFVGPFAYFIDLGERKDPSNIPDLVASHSYVEGLSDARTMHGKRPISARGGWAGEKGDFFNILLLFFGLLAAGPASHYH